MLAGIWNENLIRGKYTFRTSIGRVDGGYQSWPASNANKKNLEMITEYLSEEIYDEPELKDFEFIDSGLIGIDFLVTVEGEMVETRLKNGQPNGITIFHYLDGSTRSSLW